MHRVLPEFELSRRHVVATIGVIDGGTGVRVFPTFAFCSKEGGGKGRKVS